MEINPGAFGPPLTVQPSQTNPALQSFINNSSSGDILPAQVISSDGNTVTVTIQGFEIALPLTDMSVGDQLLLQLKANTSGILFEVLKQMQAPKSGGAQTLPVDQFQSAQMQDQTLLQSNDQATGADKSRLLPHSRPQDLAAIASRLKLPATAQVKTTIANLLQYEQAVNPRAVNDVLHLVARSLDQQEMKPEQSATAQAAQAETVGQELSSQLPRDNISETVYDRRIRAAVITRVNDLPSSPQVVRAVDELLLQVPKLQDNIQSLGAKLTGLGQNLPANSLTLLQQNAADLGQLFVQLDDLRNPAAELRLVEHYQSSVKLLTGLQTQLQNLTSQQLQSSPVLQRLDQIIASILTQFPDVSATAGNELSIQPAMLKVLDQLINVDGKQLSQDLQQAFGQIKNPKEIQNLLNKAVEFERVEIERNTLISQLRTTHTEVRGLLDRLHAVKMFALTPQNVDTQSSFVEIPLVMGEEKMSAFLKVFKRKQKTGKRKGQDEDGLNIAIVLDLENVREVETLLQWIANKLVVSFKVSSEKVRRLFTAGHEDLQDKLTAMGFAADCSVAVRRPRKELIDDSPAEEEDGTSGLDLHA